MIQVTPITVKTRPATRPPSVRNASIRPKIVLIEPKYKNVSAYFDSHSPLVINLIPIYIACFHNFVSYHRFYHPDS